MHKYIHTYIQYVHTYVSLKANPMQVLRIVTHTAHLCAADRVGGERLSFDISRVVRVSDGLDGVGAVRGWVAEEAGGHSAARARLSRDRDTTVPRWYLSRVFPSATFEEQLLRRRKYFITDRETKTARSPRRRNRSRSSGNSRKLRDTEAHRSSQIS